jgi:glutamate synthase domain-containing protein 3
MSAFMAQSGSLLICGDAGEALGDSIYEANIYVAGEISTLGADCIEKKMSKNHIKKINNLLKKANIKSYTYKNFKCYGSGRKLYNFNVDNVSEY